MSILKSWKKPSDLLPKLTKPAMVIISALLVSSLATCNASPSYAIASHYQSLNNDSFILVDMVAVRGNNAPQELRNLLKPVQHRTIADVFLCLSFANLPVMGELRLAALWWGGRGNKPFMGEYRVPFGFSGFEPPYRPNFRAIKTTPFEKV